MKPSKDAEVALVLGGAHGIGEACCRLMATRGWRVVVADLDGAAADALAREIGSTGYAIDVSDLGAIEAMKASIDRDIGPVQALVVSSGAFQERFAPQDFPMAQWRRVLQVNVEGTFNANRVFGSAMAERGRGSIVNIASTVAHGSSPLHAYAPSKAAVVNLSKGLAGQWGRRGVRVNSVSPGSTLVARVAARAPGRYAADVDAQMALGRRVLPDEVAEGVEFLASARASAITGIDLLIDAGWLTASTWGLYGGVPAAED